MRELWATKDHAEREDEEAERLVRPLPKLKPPRKDRRREEMEVERDPDVDADRDLKGDPDLSLNYKTVGGSVDPRRLAYRFLVRQALDSEKVRVRNKDTGHVTDINKDTLKEEGNKYEVIKHEEKAPGTEEPSSEQPAKPAAPPGQPEPTKEVDFKAAGAALHTLAKENPQLQSQLKTFFDKGNVGEFAEKNPTFPAAQFFKGVELPPEVKTLGDVAKAIRAVPKPPKEQAPKAKPQPKQAPAPAAAVPNEEAEKAISEAEKSLPPDLAKQLRPLFEQLGKSLAEAIQKGMPGGSEPAAKKPKKPKEPVEKPESPKAEEAPKAEEEKPAEDKKPDPEEKPKPKPEKWPGRRKVSPQEVTEAENLIAEHMPPRAAMKLMDLHPDDAKAVVEQYMGMKALGKFGSEKEANEKLSKLKEHFTLNPNEVPAPKTWKNAKGKEVLFDTLQPEDQEVAKQQHQAQVVAYNIATRDRAVQTFRSKGLPGSVAAAAVDLALRKEPETPTSPEEAEKNHADFQAKLKEAATSQFIASVSEGAGDTAINDDKRKGALQTMKALPKDAQPIAVAHLQAHDYLAIQQKYLSDTSHSDDAITEHEPSVKIIARVNRALEELKIRAKDYPKEVRKDLPDPSRIFVKKVMSRLEGLDPEKHKEVNAYFQKKKFDSYESEVGQFKKDEERYHKSNAEFLNNWEKWETKRSKAEAKHDKEHQNGAKDGPYRSPASKKPDFKFADPPGPPPEAPVEPKMPEGYLDWKTTEKPETARETRKKVNDIEKRLQSPADEEEAETKKKSPIKRIVDKFRKKKKASLSPYSSYDFQKLTMGTLPSNGFGSRQSLYHGIEPESVAPYAGWAQAHQRDLGDADHSAILASAREWMKSTVLSKSIEGMVPDTRFRAALDLSIRETGEGKYSGAINADCYNMLLAKLAGESTTETLETIREASVKPMKLASEVRHFAASVAEYDPSLAYSLLDLSDKMSADEVQPAPVVVQPVAPTDVRILPANQAADDIYDSLRASIIHTASSNVKARQTLMPLLRLIKTQDEVRALRRASTNK